MSTMRSGSIAIRRNDLARDRLDRWPAAADRWPKQSRALAERPERFGLPFERHLGRAAGRHLRVLNLGLRAPAACLLDRPAPAVLGRRCERRTHDSAAYSFRRGRSCIQSHPRPASAADPQSLAAAAATALCNGPNSICPAPSGRSPNSTIVEPRPSTRPRTTRTDEDDRFAFGGDFLRCSGIRKNSDDQHEVAEFSRIPLAARP